MRSSKVKIIKKEITHFPKHVFSSKPNNSGFQHFRAVFFPEQLFQMEVKRNSLIPTGPFTIIRASRSGHWQIILCSSEKSVRRFKVLKRSVGLDTSKVTHGGKVCLQLQPITIMAKLNSSKNIDCVKMIRCKPRTFSY